MSVSNKIKELRAKALFLLKNKGNKIEVVSIPEIPKTWSVFPGKTDLWINIEYPENSNITGCLYKGHAGSEFKGHRHPKSIEQLVILNETGKMRVYTETWSKELKYGDAVTFLKGQAHYCEFISDTMVNIIWHPKMNGWDAEFLKEKD